MVRSKVIKLKMDYSKDNDNYTENVQSPGKSPGKPQGTTSTQTSKAPGKPKRVEVISVAPISQILQRHLLRIGLYRPFVETIKEEVVEREPQAWEPPKDMPYPPSTPSNSESETEIELEIAEISIKFEEIDLDTIQIESEIEDPLLLDPLYQSSPSA